MLLIDPHQMHVMLILSLDLFCYEVQPTPGGSPEWVYCKLSFPPVLVHLIFIRLPHHHHHNVSVCCTSQPLKCCGCHTAPLSHMMGKVYSFYHDFLIGEGDKLWDMWANSDICLVFWPRWLLRKRARASWPVENPPPTGEKGEGVAWTASDKEQLNY